MGLKSLFRLGLKKYHTGQRIGLKGLNTVDSGLNLGSKINSQVSGYVGTGMNVLNKASSVLNTAIPIVDFFSSEKGNKLKELQKYANQGKSGLNLLNRVSGDVGRLISEGRGLVRGTKGIVKDPSTIMKEVRNMSREVGAGESTLKDLYNRALETKSLATTGRIEKGFEKTKSKNKTKRPQYIV